MHRSHIKDKGTCHTTKVTNSDHLNQETCEQGQTMSNTQQPERYTSRLFSHFTYAASGDTLLMPMVRIEKVVTTDHLPLFTTSKDATQGQGIFLLPTSRMGVVGL